MARRRRGDDERSMDALMDALTNVVGILLLILIVSSLGISAAVKKVVENLPEVTQEELEAMRVSRDKTLKNLQELEQTHITTLENLPTEDEAKALAAELEDFEKDNSDLAEKTSDIEEWMKKVEEEETKKDEFAEKVSVADTRNRELAAILAQTPEVEVKAAKVVAMPNPRVADDRARALYVICKNQKLYFVGDPYEHALKIRNVIDQNFSDLAFTDKKLGAYTYALKGLKRNDNDTFAAITERVNLTRSTEKELESWAAIRTKWVNRQGVEAPEKNVVERLFGTEDRKEFSVQKFRYDLKKIISFFGDGKFGPTDFRYYVSKGGGDRIKFSVGPREEAGWTTEELLKQDSAFDTVCKNAVLNRGTLFYYYVAPDSFDTYLQARAKSESYRIPAGWSVWDGDRLELQAVPIQTTIDYNLDVIPDDEYKKLANKVGPFMVAEVAAEITEFDARVAAAVPEKIKKPEEKATFIKKLTEERLAFLTTRLQGYSLAPFQAALAAAEASGTAEVQIEIHPPEIPHIRVFVGANPPKAPKPEIVEDDKIGEKPGGGNQPVGGNKLILD